MVRADEDVAIRERIGRDRQVHRCADRRRILPQRTLVIADGRHAGQRKDRQRHVEIEVGHDGGCGHGRTPREIAGAEQPLLLRRDDGEEDGALGLHLGGLQRAADFQQARHARGIVKGAVVDGIALDRRADAIAVQMCGQNDIFIAKGGVAARHHGDQIGRGQFPPRRFDPGLEALGQRKARYRRGRIGRCRYRRKIMARSVEQQRRTGRVELRVEEGTIAFAQRRVGIIERRRASEVDAPLPGDFDLRRRDQADEADGPLRRQIFGALRPGVGFERARDVRGAARQHHHDLPLEVQSRKIIMSRLRQVQAVAGEDQRRVDRCGNGAAAARKDQVPRHRQGRLPLRPDQHGAAPVRLHHLLDEGDRLLVAIDTHGLEPERPELPDHIFRRAVIARRAGAPPLHAVIGDRLDMSPPAGAVRVHLRVRLGTHAGGRQQKRDEGQRE